MIRPYGERGKHMGTSSTSLPPPHSLDFDFEKCDVAQWIIEYFESNSLQHRNGVPTELFKHAVKCPRCKNETAPIISKPEEKTVRIEFDSDIIKRLRQWQKKNNFESQRLDQCVILLLDYFDFAKRELKGRM